jgi:asparagine synthase (glutamine-hydrolysing)
MREIGGPSTELHTFSFLAEDPRHSEEHWIDLIAKHVGSVQHKVRPTGKDLAQHLDDVIAAQGEPFGSTSIYAQYEVFRLAGDAGVRVLLDGQGADELLGGYLGYRLTMIRDKWKSGLRREAIHRALALRNTSTTATRDSKLLADALKARFVQYRNRYAHRLLPRTSSGWLIDPSWIERHQTIRQPIHPDLSSQLVYSLVSSSVPALLRFEDRNSMRFSVESRVPFLTVPLANFILSLPNDFVIDRNGRTKAIFREAMRGIVPNPVLDRTDKIGFTPSERKWLNDGGLNRVDVAPHISTEPVNIDELNERMSSQLASDGNIDWALWRAYNLLRWRQQ